MLRVNIGLLPWLVDELRLKFADRRDFVWEKSRGFEKIEFRLARGVVIGMEMGAYIKFNCTTRELAAS